MERRPYSAPEPKPSVADLETDRSVTVPDNSLDRTVGELDALGVGERAVVVRYLFLRPGEQPVAIREEIREKLVKRGDVHT